MIRKNSTICANYQLIMRMIGGFLKILELRKTYYSLTHTLSGYIVWP